MPRMSKCSWMNVVSRRKQKRQMNSVERGK